MSNSLRKSARNGLITHTVMSQGETSDEDEDVIHTMESSKRAKTSPHESFSTISPIPGGSNYHPAEIFGSECGHQHPNQQQHPQPQRISGISHGQLPPRGDEWNDRRLTEWNDRVNTMINEFAVEPDVHNLTKLYERYLEGRSGNGRGGGYPLARFLFGL
jgi:hypothetical protein